MRDDLETLRFSYEIRLFARIKTALGAVPVIDFHQGRQLLESRHRDLLGDAARITSDLLPAVHEAYQSALDTVGAGLSGELFVQQSSVYNANIFGHGDRFNILVHSALIRDFSGEELRFVFGHELGHIIFQHHLFSVREMVSSIREMDTGAANLLLRYARATEISADRVGLLCCGRLPPAVSALFKISSGLTGVDSDRMLRSLQDQFRELEQQLRSTRTAAGWVRTHPMIPVRFKAMELAALDIIAMNRGNPAFSDRGFRRIDQQIAAILEALDQCAP